MAEKKSDKKPKRKHLRQIRSEYADDGSVVHHHTYMGADGQREPERTVGTSQDADEAGQHVADNFGQNTPMGDPGAADEPDPTDQGSEAGTAEAAPAAGV